jgi:hypothetical protein
MRVDNVISGQLPSIVSHITPTDTEYALREFVVYDIRVTHCRHVSDFGMLKCFVRYL